MNNTATNTATCPTVRKQIGKTTYTYDALDNIAKVTDVLRQVTSYTYDKNGNQSPGNTSNTFVYDTSDIRVVVNSNGDVITVILNRR